MSDGTCTFTEEARRQYNIMAVLHDRFRGTRSNEAVNVLLNLMRMNATVTMAEPFCHALDATTWDAETETVKLSRPIMLNARNDYIDMGVVLHRDGSLGIHS